MARARFDPDRNINLVRGMGGGLSNLVGSYLQSEQVDKKQRESRALDTLATAVDAVAKGAIKPDHVSVKRAVDRVGRFNPDQAAVARELMKGASKKRYSSVQGAKDRYLEALQQNKMLTPEEVHSQKMSPADQMLLQSADLEGLPLTQAEQATLSRKNALEEARQLPREARAGYLAERGVIPETTLEDIEDARVKKIDDELDYKRQLGEIAFEQTMKIHNAKREAPATDRERRKALAKSREQAMKYMIADNKSSIAEAKRVNKELRDANKPGRKKLPVLDDQGNQVTQPMVVPLAVSRTELSKALTMKTLLGRAEELEEIEAATGMDFAPEEAQLIDDTITQIELMSVRTDPGTGQPIPTAGPEEILIIREGLEAAAREGRLEEAMGELMELYPELEPPSVIDDILDPATRGGAKTQAAKRAAKGAA